MNKLVLTIGIILLVIIGGGIYLNTLDGETIKEKLGLSEIQEEEQEPKGIVIKEIVSGNNE